MAFLALGVDDHWIAVDLEVGRGWCGRPDGSWLQLQRQQGDHWQILDPAPGLRLDYTVRPQLIGSGRLRQTDCRSVNWRITQVDADQQRRFASDQQPREFRAFGCR